MSTILTQNKYGAAHKFNVAAHSLSEPFTIDGEDDLPACIITNYKVTSSDNIQFTPTIGDDLYIYVLGTTPYTITIGGWLYNEACSDGDSSETSERCIAKLLAKYESLKASKHTEPLKIRIGKAAFVVVLQDVVINGSSENKADIFTFNMTFKGVKI